MHFATRSLALVLVLAVVAQSANAHSAPSCNALERFEKNAPSFDANLLLRDDKLVFKRQDNVTVTITRERELQFDGKPVALTSAGREMVGTYYDNMNQAINEVAGLAGDAALLGLSTASTAVFRLLTGKLDEEEFERDVEAEARKLEERAHTICMYLAEIEQLERKMAVEIPGFIPVIFPVGQTI